MKKNLIKTTSEGIKMVYNIQSHASTHSQNIYHLTLHPATSLSPDQLFYENKSFIRNNMICNKYTVNKDDFCKFFTVVEYGHSVLDLNNGNISRLGIHSHTLFTSKKQLSQIQSDITNYLAWNNWNCSINVTHFKKIYNKTYWVKQLPYLKSIESIDNFTSFKTWNEKRKNRISTFNLLNTF